ncbi:hypothetical protein D3C76_1155530 [compost metagenome]
MLFLVAFEYQGQQRVDQEYRNHRHQAVFLGLFHFLEQRGVAVRLQGLVEDLLDAGAVTGAGLDRLAAAYHAVLLGLAGGALGAFLLLGGGGHGENVLGEAENARIEAQLPEKPKCC